MLEKCHWKKLAVHTSAHLIGRNGYNGSPRNICVSNLHSLWGGLSLRTEEYRRAEPHTLVDNCVQNGQRLGIVEIAAGQNRVNLIAQSLQPLWVQGKVDEQERQGGCGCVTIQSNENPFWN
jgi:hypothetical protein